MQLTNWQEKGTVERIIYCLETPFTLLRWMTIPPVLYDEDDDKPQPEGEEEEDQAEPDADAGEDLWAHAGERVLTALALPGFTSWVIFYIFAAQMDDFWPMLGSDTCVPCADCETAATAAECGAFVGDEFEKCDGDSGCDYTEAPISVWAVVTLCSLPLIPLVWRLTDARRRPPEWFKLTLLFLSFLRYAPRLAALILIVSALECCGVVQLDVLDGRRGGRGGGCAQLPRLHVEHRHRRPRTHRKQHAPRSTPSPSSDPLLRAAGAGVGEQRG